MGEVAQAGRTVLFVSHNMAAIQNLCMYCIWIDNGIIRKVGDTSNVVNSYLQRPSQQDFESEMKLLDWPDRYGKGGVRIINARLLDEKNKKTTTVFRTRPMSIEFDFESNSPHPLLFSVVIAAESGEWILHLSQYDTVGMNPRIVDGKYQVRFSIPSLPLNEGNYTFVIGVHTENTMPLDVVRNVLPFEVQDIEESPRPFKTSAELAFCWTRNFCSISKL